VSQVGSSSEAAVGPFNREWLEHIPDGLPLSWVPEGIIIRGGVALLDVALGDVRDIL